MTYGTYTITMSGTYTMSGNDIVVRHLANCTLRVSLRNERKELHCPSWLRSEA